jgi:chromosome segregation protein
VKLKELEIFGFKSFADRTLIRFDKGITIVVGPNGSGKSNIFDSIRWVLGSQSPKSLRGSKMEDVIFVGSDDRKTLGMAEVSLTFDNEDRSLNINYTEVKITRRLYRSGESEYFINENPVRLKDILEMFMDTGLGIDSYSIISQGEVDRIINAKPIERREIFEEAAGITKYIKKRDEALRKLETTEQNMLRINDILVEVKRQTGSLERQAKKAEKYKEMKEEWSNIVIQLMMKEIKDKNGLNASFESEKNECERRIEEENTKLSTHEMKFEEMKLLSIEREREINEKKEKWLIRQQEIKRLEDNLKFLSQRHVELSQRIEELRSANIDNVGRMENLKVEISEKEKTLLEIQEKINFRQAAINAMSSEVDEFNLGFEASRKARDEKGVRIQQKSAALNGHKNKMVEYEVAIKNADEILLRNEEEKKSQEEKLRLLSAELDRLSETRVLKEGEVKKIKEQESELLKEKIAKAEAKEILDNILNELNLGISRMESRHNFLRQMHEKMEGYGEIVRKVLTEYKETLPEGQKDNVVDVVANLIAVEKPYEAAVEKTLSGLLQTVLVREESVIKDIFTSYAEVKGEISLLNTGNLKTDPDAVINRWRGLVKHENILAYLPDKIAYDQKNEIVRLLFYNIFAVENIEKANEVFLAAGIHEEYYLLTLNGELLSNFNIHKKAEGGEETGSGFLSREREINEINNEILMARQKFASIEDEKHIQEAKLAEMEAQIEDLSALYHSQFVEVVKDDERIRQKQEDRQNVGALIKKLDEQKESREADRENIKKELVLVSDKWLALENEINMLGIEIEAAVADIKAKEEELTRRRATLEEKRIELMKLKNDHEVELNNSKMLSSRLVEVEKFYENTAREIDDLNSKALKAEEERTTGELKIEEDRKILGSDENEWNERRVSFDQYKGDMTGLENYIKEMGKERDSLRQKQFDLKIKLNEISLALKNIYDKMQEEFKMTPEESAVNGVEINEEQFNEMHAKAEDMKEKMDKLGVINLVAIEEYNELKNRQEFLQTQYDDLSSGRENLKKVIRKTNEESRTIFTKAFQEIRVKFAEVFKKMMNGGEADLVMIDADNILESGIEIVARPPGKKLQNITLLSGGEKSITAVSLLFALFLTKASPFCIMDEVDAALDDMNIARFTNLVKSFENMTQFLIITHNKITMEIADTIYGVSMEKAGVSKIISVKLEGKRGGVDKQAHEREKEKDSKRGKFKKEQLDGFIDMEKLNPDTMTEIDSPQAAAAEILPEEDVEAAQEVMDEETLAEGRALDDAAEAGQLAELDVPEGTEPDRDPEKKDE